MLQAKVLEIKTALFFAISRDHILDQYSKGSNRFFTKQDDNNLGVFFTQKSGDPEEALRRNRHKIRSADCNVVFIISGKYFRRICLKLAKA